MFHEPRTNRLEGMSQMESKFFEQEYEERFLKEISYARIFKNVNSLESGVVEEEEQSEDPQYQTHPSMHS